MLILKVCAVTSLCSEVKGNCRDKVFCMGRLKARVPSRQTVGFKARALTSVKSQIPHNELFLL